MKKLIRLACLGLITLFSMNTFISSFKETHNNEANIAKQQIKSQVENNVNQNAIVSENTFYLMEVALINVMNVVSSKIVNYDSSDSTKKPFTSLQAKNEYLDSLTNGSYSDAKINEWNGNSQLSPWFMLFNFALMFQFNADGKTFFTNAITANSYTPDSQPELAKQYTKAYTQLFGLIPNTTDPISSSSGSKQTAEFTKAHILDVTEQGGYYAVAMKHYLPTGSEIPSTIENTNKIDATRLKMLNNIYVPVLSNIANSITNKDAIIDFMSMIALILNWFAISKAPLVTIMTLFLTPLLNVSTSDVVLSQIDITDPAALPDIVKFLVPLEAFAFKILDEKHAEASQVAVEEGPYFEYLFNESQVITSQTENKQITNNNIISDYGKISFLYYLFSYYAWIETKYEQQGTNIPIELLVRQFSKVIEYIGTKSVSFFNIMFGSVLNNYNITGQTINASDSSYYQFNAWIIGQSVSEIFQNPNTNVNYQPTTNQANLKVDQGSLTMNQANQFDLIAIMSKDLNRKNIYTKYTNKYNETLNNNIKDNFSNMTNTVTLPTFDTLTTEFSNIAASYVTYYQSQVDFLTSNTITQKISSNELSSYKKNVSQLFDPIAKPLVGNPSITTLVSYFTTLAGNKIAINNIQTTFKKNNILPKDNLGLILGITIPGSILLIGLIIFSFWYFKRHKKNTIDEDKPSIIKAKKNNRAL